MIRNHLSSIGSKLISHIDRTESSLANWSDSERKFSIGYMRVWKRGTFAFSVIFALISIANAEMPESIWLLRISILLGTLYIITTWVSRMFSEGYLLGPLKWLYRYPMDLLNVNG